MLVKFLNSGDRVSTTIAGSYFKGDGWTGAYYDSDEGRLVFESEDGLGFTTGDLRVATGGPSSVEWTTVLNKPTSFPPSAHTHPWAGITDVPATFPPAPHVHSIANITGLQAALDALAAQIDNWISPLDMSRVSRVETSASAGMISDGPGSSKTSSKVRPSRISMGSLRFAGRV